MITYFYFIIPKSSLSFNVPQNAEYTLIYTYIHMYAKNLYRVEYTLYTTCRTNNAIKNYAIKPIPILVK